MKNDIDLLHGILEDVNILYKKHGDDIFPALRRLLKERPGSKIADRYVSDALTYHQENPSAEMSKRLINSYRRQTKQGLLNPDLSSWILDGLKDVSEGADFNETFGLKKPPHRPKGTVSKSQLHVSCTVELYKRQGLKAEAAKTKVENQLGVSRRVIRDAIRDFKIGSHIETGVLVEMARIDYGDLLV